MPGARLTAETVRSLRPRTGRVRDVYFDKAKGAPPGFALRVTSNGARSFVYVYRSPLRGAAAPKVYLNLGDADHVSLADAREQARQAHSLRELGKDPKVERDHQARAQQQAPRVEDLIQQRIDAIERISIAKTIAEYRRILKAQIKGSGFGALKAKDVRRADIRAFLDGIDGDAMAINTYKLIRASFAWGVREEVVESNPAHDMKPRLEGRLTDEERTLTDDDLAKVLLRSEVVGPVAAAYVRILALCGTRRTETAFAKWTDLELAERSSDGHPTPTWVIPPENRKGRAGKKRGLVVPLSPEAVQTFEELKRRSGKGDWIFAGERLANVSANFGRLGVALKKATRVDFGFHDLRATCATGVGRLGAPPHVIAVLLGHQGVPGTPHVTSRYDRSDRLPEVRQALNRWGEHVQRLIESARSCEKPTVADGGRPRLAKRGLKSVDIASQSGRPT
jgi:integrase